MKSLIVFILFYYINYASMMPTDDESVLVKKHLMAISTSCRVAEAANANDVDDMLNRIPPITRTGKCFNACMMEQFSIIVNGKYMPDGLVKLGKLTSGDNLKVINVLTDLSNECKSVSDPDRCELSVKVTQCLDNMAKQRNISEKDFV